jgi:predicted CXXCH cytochrome family protein
MSNYRIYESSTLDAKPGQPTGSSKLCLSCHDGTIALGGVLSRPDLIRMVGGERIPAGLTNLGTDVSDDHPVSFVYSSGIAASDRQLVGPNALPPEVKLDANGQMQCTSCHDPHQNKYGDFLVMDNRFGALCTSCHVMDGWTATSHQSAGAGVTSSQSGEWPYATVAENACRGCHRSHTAGGRARLLIFEHEEDNCLSCHDGSVARTDLRSELDKPSGHDPRQYLDLHDPVEAFSVDRKHVECVDCHNPHATAPHSLTTSFAPIGATLAKTPGVTAGGGQTLSAQNEYEVCYRCHAESAAAVHLRVDRQAQMTNVRLKFVQTNPSFHPVMMSATGTDTVSLVPQLTRGSMIRCTDCHNNDAGPRAGGAGPDGPHGSMHESLLEKNYTVRDDTSESEYEYALCYKCHLRTSILSDASFPLHRLHIVRERTPCAVCHDPHGISSTVDVESDHTHLINFDTRAVWPEQATGRIRFRDLGRFSGSCTLTCHGAEHRDALYGAAASVTAPTDASGAKRVRRVR